MKKLLLIPTLLFSLSYGETDNIFNTTVQQERNLYKSALKYYKNKNYKKSYELFNELFQTNLDNILVNYYLGRSAFMLKEYEFALSAYERILMQQPNNHKVRLELAQTYIHMGLWAQALNEYTIVSKKELPVNIKQRVEKTIELLKNKEKRSSISLYALLSMVYDSNINNTSKIGSFDIYSSQLDTNLIVDNSSKKESAMVYQAVANLNHKYKLSDSFIWDSNLTSINLKYVNHKDKDINMISFSTGPVNYKKKYKTSLSFIVDKVFLGHNPYQFNYYIKPTYTRSITKKLVYNVSLKAGRVNFRDSPDLDAKVIELANSLGYLSNSFGLFNLKATVGKEIEVNKPRTDVTYNYYDFLIGNSLSIFDNYKLMTSANYKVSKYKDYDTNFQIKREDKKRVFSIGLERQIGKNMGVSLGSTYTKRDSNQEPSQYSKYTAKLSFYMSF